MANSSAIMARKMSSSHETPQQSESKSKLSFGPLRLLAWVLGGVSVFNLVDEFSPLKLLGKLEQWMDAYSSFVNDITTFLFGWMEFRWMEINENEVHILVIALIIASAFARGAPIDDLFYKFGAAIVYVAIAPFLLLFLPALLLPSWGGLVGAIIGAVLLVGLYIIMISDEDPEIPTYGRWLKEIVGVCVAFLLLVVLNYTVFQWI